MSTYQGTNEQKERINEAVSEGMKSLAKRLWSDMDYDVVNDPEEIREHVRTVVMLLVYRGWIDFRTPRS